MTHETGEALRVPAALTTRAKQVRTRKQKQRVLRNLREADIKGFFDNIQWEWLERMLERRIADRAIMNLIRKWLRAGMLEEDGTVIHPQTGTPQGGIVSPVLANIYLHYVLDLWFERVVQPKHHGRCRMIRFADDFVACFALRHSAEAFERDLKTRLAKFGLEVAPDKTKTLRFGHHGEPVCSG